MSVRKKIIISFIFVLVSFYIIPSTIVFIFLKTKNYVNTISDCFIVSFWKTWLNAEWYEEYTSMPKNRFQIALIIIVVSLSFFWLITSNRFKRKRTQLKHNSNSERIKRLESEIEELKNKSP